MRLLKENTAHIVPFYQVLTGQQETPQQRSWKSGRQLRKLDSAVPEKFAFMTETFIQFEEEAALLTDPIELLELLKQSIKKIIPLKESALFYFDATQTNLLPYKLIPAPEFVSAVNRYWKEGVLQQVFEERKPAVFPLLSEYSRSGSSLQTITFPVFDGHKETGLYVIFTPIQKENLGKFERDSVRLLVQSGLNKLENVTIKEKLNTSYAEIQTYQAKLSNDFRLAAIGEMTGGILEDIGTPLQVIVSAADLISDDDNAPIAQRIKNQVNKIQQTIRRLVKFAELNQKNVAILPCNLNDIIVEYHQLVKTSLENLGVECVLDLDKNLPPVLSHNNYIYQILANVFGMIKSFMRESGGIILQTGTDNEAVIVRIVNSANLFEIMDKSGKQMKIENLNLRIITNLMKKHEGTCTIDAGDMDSSIITLRFPIRRKLRQ